MESVFASGRPALAGDRLDRLIQQRKTTAVGFVQVVSSEDLCRGSVGHYAHVQQHDVIEIFRDRL